MKLKEAFTYQNYLSDLLSQAKMYLLDTGFTMTRKEVHFRNAANPDAEDETIEVPKTKDVDFSPNDVINFVALVIKEKDELSCAIAEAKKSLDININEAISINKIKQNWIQYFDILCAEKSYTKTYQGSGYSFDINKEQKVYYYDITETGEIDFNRNEVRGLIKKYKKSADEVSSEIDMVMLTSQVDYTPIWDMNDHLEDILTKE